MISNMVNMARTPMEMEQSNPEKEEPVYPYGLSLTLSDEELERLGLDHADEDCQVGNFLHLHALAEITGIHKNSTADGDKCCINLQITHLSAENEDEENEEADDEMDGMELRAAGPY